MNDKKYNTSFIIAMIICIAFSIYLVISIYFVKHFYFGTYINDVNVSWNTIEQAERKLLDESYNYVLELNERNNVTEYIYGNKIDFKYEGNNEVEKIKKTQNAFLWPLYLLFNNRYNINNVYSYNKDLLNEEFDKLTCFNKEGIIEPLDACFRYENGEFEIIKEVYGNKINKDYLYAYIINSVSRGIKSIFLDEADVYENPVFTSESSKVIETQKQLNKYVSTNVYYIFDDEIEILDGNTINTWLEIDQMMTIVFNENEIKDYLNELSKKYDTYGKVRSFKATTGKLITVSGGNYGWKIDKTKELESLIEDIKNGNDIKREPIYLQQAMGNRQNDIGNTYVEINLTSQFLWFYKDGKLITQGDIVTGNVSRGNGTPEGTYILNYKQKNATLKGEGYSSDVKYWMPFNCNIGIHDASWRWSFGGTIYKSDGSHGCVNAPLYLAKKIYENIEPGTPIVCYKQEE